MLPVIDLTDALKELFVKRYLVVKVCQHWLHLLLYLAQFVGLVSLNKGKEHPADAVERLPALLQSKDGVLKGCRVLVLHYLGDFIAMLLNGCFEGRQIVCCLNLTEVRGPKRQGALLQQRVFALVSCTTAELYHRR